MEYPKRQKGFTLVEIMVATVLFVVVVVALLSLFNYILRINRRSEALRQASQGMRDFVEYLVKQVRNGQINYGYADPGGTQPSSLPAPCSNIVAADYTVAPGYGTALNKADNKLGLLDTDNNEICLYYASAGTTYIGSAIFTGGTNLVLAKGSSPLQILNASNFKINKAMFLVQPTKDPYSPGNSKGQPFVTIIINFQAVLPTGEQVPIYYQTTVSTSKYDILNSP